MSATPATAEDSNKAPAAACCASDADKQSQASTSSEAGGAGGGDDSLIQNPNNHRTRSGDDIIITRELLTEALRHKVEQPPPSAAAAAQQLHASAALFMRTLAPRLEEPMFFLSKEQADVITARTSLMRQHLGVYVPFLPGWLPYSVVTRACGHSAAAIRGAQESCAGGGRPFVWATEFENVHTTWSFREPGFTFRGVKWGGSEQLFQCQKVGEIGSAAFTEEAPRFGAATEAQATSLGRAAKLRIDWEEARVPAMVVATREKFTQDEGLRHLLLGTYPHALVSVKDDAFWGSGPDGKGRNFLGRVLMALRETLLQEDGRGAT